jgi:hypothetical protein
LHKNLNIVRIVWTKKIERLRKEHFSLIIEFVNFEMIKKLIKNDLLNDYSHQVCEYFEKKMQNQTMFSMSKVWSCQQNLSKRWKMRFLRVRTFFVRMQNIQWTQKMC